MFPAREREWGQKLTPILPRNTCHYTALPYNLNIKEFIEAPAFTKYLYDYLTDDEYAGLQSYLALYSNAGAKIPNAGGVRKLRWEMTSRGKGKRGDARIIYFYHVSDSEIWLLTIYAKSDKATIPAHIFRKIAQEFEDG